MVWWWWIIPGFVAVIGLAIALSGLGWMFRGRPFKGGRGVLGGAVFLGIGAIVGLLGLSALTAIVRGDPQGRELFGGFLFIAFVFGGMCWLSRATASAPIPPAPIRGRSATAATVRLPSPMPT